MANALKVLIVDDDKSSAQSLSEIVKRLGFKPIVVNKATDALNVVRLQTVHAAIVDVLLPKMTGVELVHEFRATRFAENPVVLVSGVFKDKAFSTEALRKTQAHSYLCKPFQLDEISKSLKSAMESLINAEKWSVQSLLTRRLNSDRERAKAIEHLEQIRGLDFPFVLSILMEVGSSGSLNIVNELGEIFGVSLMQGSIAGVDSHESQATAILSLISKGYLGQEDLDTMQADASKRLTLERLVREGFVSPHAVSVARQDQIISDLKTICSAETLQVNFVPVEDRETPPKHAVRLEGLMSVFVYKVDEFFTIEYLQEFYSSMIHSPIRLIHLSHAVMSVWDSPKFKSLKALKSAIEKGETIGEALAADGDNKVKIFQCVHYLVLIRAIMFDDPNRAKNLGVMLERYNKLYEQISGRTPDKIFEYFGAKANANSSALNSIWTEFSNSNDPAKLGPEATPELLELCQKCYDLVATAKEIMLDDTKRATLMQQIESDKATRQHQSTILVTEAYDLLRQGKFKDANAKLLEAGKLHTNNRWQLVQIWCEIKLAKPDLKSQLADFVQKLEAMTSEERKNPLFYYVMGLVKMHAGDPTANQNFEKALQLDPEFTDARKELTGKTARDKKNEKVNIFTGDLSEVVSQLFRKK